MSREIDLDKPLSDEDRAYLKDRSQLDVIAENDRRFKEAEEPEEPEVDEDGGQKLKSSADPARSWEPGSEPGGKFAQRPFDPQVSGAFYQEPVDQEGFVAGPEDAPQEQEGTEDDLDSWTVDELKDELRSQDLPTSGSKAELVKRLRDA